MLKKVLIPAAAILTICFTPATLFAGTDITLTGSDLKGHWLLAEAEFSYEASFDSNGDCHVIMTQREENKVISVEDQEVFDYEIFDSTLCYYNEHSVRALDIISQTPDLLICQDSPNTEDSEYCLTLFIKADCIDSE